MGKVSLFHSLKSFHFNKQIASCKQACLIGCRYFLWWHIHKSWSAVDTLSVNKTSLNLIPAGCLYGDTMNYLLINLVYNILCPFFYNLLQTSLFCINFSFIVVYFHIPQNSNNINLQVKCHKTSFFSFLFFLNSPSVLTSFLRILNL